MPGILDDFLALQRAHDPKERVGSWKNRICPDRVTQRLLIIRNLSSRFVGSTIKEVHEKRAAGTWSGDVRGKRRGGSTTSSASSALALPQLQALAQQRPVTAPQPTGKLTRQSSWFTHLPVRPSTSHDDVRQFKGLKDYENLKVFEKRRHFLQTISNKHNRDQAILSNELSTQISIESRDSGNVFNSLLTMLPGAQRVSLFFDALGGAKKRVTAFPDGSFVLPSKLRKTGVAIVLDPSIVTKGKKVMLYVRYEASAENFGSSGGLGSSLPNTARSPSPSPSRPSSRPGTSSGLPASAQSGAFSTLSSSAAEGCEKSSLPHIHASTSATTGAGSSRPNTSRSSRGGSRPSSRGRSGTAGGASRPPILSRAYRLRGVGRFDLPLVVSNTAAGLAVDDGDLYDTFLPGWDDIAPIFIPANACVCSIVVTDATDDDWQGSGSRNPSRSAGLSPGVSTATWRRFGGSDVGSSPSPAPGARRKTATSEFAPAAPAVFVVPMCAFPCKSQQHAVHLLNKFMESTFRPRAANVAVPGGLALQTAAFHGNVEAVQLLLSNGASVNLKTNRFPRSTALHDAVLGGQEEVVRLLLQSGAKQTLTDDGAFFASLSSPSRLLFHYPLPLFLTHLASLFPFLLLLAFSRKHPLARGGRPKQRANSPHPNEGRERRGSPVQAQQQGAATPGPGQV